MSFVMGIVLFAVGILASIALHEWGHLMAARLCGMRVRRYFIGFGPRVLSFRRVEKRTTAALGRPVTTEYGLKAIPLGGFCDIAGMTINEELSEDDKPFAMVHKRAYQRIIVLLGGIAMNIVLGIVILYGVVVAWGAPNPNPDLTMRVQSTQCVPAVMDLRSAASDSSSPSCTGSGPAASAGIQAGDEIIAVDGISTPSYRDVTDALQQAFAQQTGISLEKTPAGSADTSPSTASSASEAHAMLTIRRDGEELQIEVPIQGSQRIYADGSTQTVGMIGITRAPIPNATLDVNAVTGIPVAFQLTGEFIQSGVTGVLHLPSAIPNLVHSIAGAERDANTPVSVVGASVAGGELVEHAQWQAFFVLLASLNIFLAVFNLIPLPPLDGGHIAVVLYQVIRDRLRRARGLEPRGPVDYRTLMPVTVGFFAILLAFGLLVIAVDIVNPITIFR